MRTQQFGISLAPNIADMSKLRVANLVGSITNRRGSGQPRGNAPLERKSAYWIEVLTSLALATRFDTFIFWPEIPSSEQIELFAREAVEKEQT